MLGNGVSDAVACTTEQTQVGEGVRWDARRDELLRVDILAGRVYHDRVDDAAGLVPVRTYQVPGTVGAAAPVEGDEGCRSRLRAPVAGGLAAPARRGVSGGHTDERRRLRSAGPFWTGTLADDRREGGGALDRLDRNGRTELTLGGGRSAGRPDRGRRP